MQITLNRCTTVRYEDGRIVNARVVDPYGSQEFIINRFGWVTSDISLLFNADSQNLQDNLLSRLQVLKSDAPNLTARQMLDTLVPRYCQSYAERARFMEYMHKEHPDFFEDKVEDTSSDETKTE